MRILCQISVQNRDLPAHNLSSKTRFVKSTLALCKLPKSEEYCLIIFNSKNENGVKYNLKNNVQTIIAKFIMEGKATIQLKTPHIDIYIQGADVIQLKAFLNTCKLILQNKAPDAIIKMSSLDVKPIKSKDQPVLKLNITSRSEYPVRGFPNTVRELTINGIKRMSMDVGIFKLMKLVKLDLSDNLITKIPDEIKLLPNLQILNLSKNKLGVYKHLPWNWIDGHLRTKLQVLNLSGNKLQVVPNQIGRFKNLTHLILKDNLLVTLPHCVKKLKTLEELDLENNELEYLPRSLLFLKLRHLNLTGFRGIPGPPNEMRPNRNGLMVSLKEAAGNVVLNFEKVFDASIIPRTLVDFLEGAKYCYCGKANLGDTWNVRCIDDHSLIGLSYSHTIGANEDPKIKVEILYCFDCIIFSHLSLMYRRLLFFK